MMAAKAKKKVVKEAVPKSNILVDVKHVSPLTLMNIDSTGRVRFAVDEQQGKGIDLHLSRVMAQFPELPMDAVNDSGVEVEANIAVQVVIKKR